MKKSKYFIRESQPADLPQIAALLDRELGPVPYEQRLMLWRWRYDLNPARSGTFPHFLVIEGDGGIVGVQGLVPVAVKVYDSKCIAAFSCDLAVADSARSSSLKLKMNFFSPDISPLAISTSANRSANKVTLALGGKEVSNGYVKYVKPLNYGHFISRLLHIKFRTKCNKMIQLVAHIIGIPLNKFSISRYTSNSLLKSEHNRIDTISSFDDTHAKLFEKHSLTHQIQVIRDSVYLNWRYRDYPFEGIQCFGLVRDNELCGYGVIHLSNDEEGIWYSTILELYFSENDVRAFEMLLHEAVMRSLQAKACYISMRWNSRDTDNILIGNGFRAIHTEFSTITYKTNSEQMSSLMSGSSEWYFSYGDGDICYFYS